jgi:hypothetical protein
VGAIVPSPLLNTPLVSPLVRRTVEFSNKNVFRNRRNHRPIIRVNNIDFVVVTMFTVRTVHETHDVTLWPLITAPEKDNGL